MAATFRSSALAMRLPVRQLPQTVSQCSRTAPRRFASDHSHSHGAHAHAGPASESFGKSFYYTLLLIPTGYLLYTVSVGASNSRDGGLVGRAIKAYGDLRTTWVERNALHTKMVEQAGHDKNLFYNARMPNHIDLKSPEVGFSSGSPYNVPAGHAVNLDKLMAHYKEQFTKEEEEKIARLQEQSKK